MLKIKTMKLINVFCFIFRQKYDEAKAKKEQIEEYRWAQQIKKKQLEQYRWAQNIKRIRKENTGGHNN